MTENIKVAPPVTPATEPKSTWRLLRRSTDDRLVAGVSGGLGRHFDVDPVIFRVLFAVLTVFSSGAWLLVYAACWLIIPEDGTDTSIARAHYGDQIDRTKERIDRGDKTSMVVLAALAVLLVVAVFEPILSGVLISIAAIAVIIAWFKQRNIRRDRAQATPARWWEGAPADVSHSAAPGTTSATPPAPGSVSVTKQTPPTGNPGTV